MSKRKKEEKKKYQTNKQKKKQTTPKHTQKKKGRGKEADMVEPRDFSHVCIPGRVLPGHRAGEA